jgi:hypothetical protein
VETAEIVGADPPADYRPRQRRFSVWTVVLLLAFVLFFGLLYRFRRPLFSSVSHIAAVRVLPRQAAAGGVVPLVVRVSGPAAGSFILEERLPAGVELVRAAPAPRNTRGKVRWLGVMKGGTLLYSCEIRIPRGRQGRLAFRGILRLKDKWLPVAGAREVVVRPCHWADADCDMRIDDDEILAAYELLGDAPFFEDQRLALDDMWAAESYRLPGARAALTPPATAVPALPPGSRSAPK